MKNLLVCMAGLLAALAPVDVRQVGDVIISGVATAKDGDDVIVNGIDIRLQGIAAPEDEPDGTKAQGRPVARCYLDWRDIGELQVLAGHARDCPRFSSGRYADEEGSARSAGRDLSAIYPLPNYCTPR